MKPRTPHHTTITATAVVAMLVLSGCAPPTSEAGEVITVTDPRIPEILAARDVLAAPVPGLVAEAGRLAAALEQLWVAPTSAEERATVARSLRLAPFEEALAALATVELEGEGPDVVAARAIVATMLDEAEALAGAVSTEVESLTGVVDFDDRLEALLPRWDERGSYTAQLAAFEQLAVDARALAAQAEERTATPACTGLWERRSEAARTVAERTDELRVLIRDRRGQQFDELRDSYRQDPYGVADLLGALDAEAAEACWVDGSQVPGLAAAIAAHPDELAEVLDPVELRR